MIDEVEICPSNRALCNCCNKIIEKGTPRICEEFTGKNYLGKRYYCYKCFETRFNIWKENIEGEIERTKQIKKQFEELMNKPEVKKILILNEL